MAITKTKDYWKLIMETGLQSKEACKQLYDQYNKESGSEDPQKLAGWLAMNQHLTTYQARALLSGKPGLVVIGDYQVQDRVESKNFSGTLQAVHGPTSHPVWLHPIAAEIQADSVRWSIVQRMCELRSSAVHPHLIRCFHLRVGSKRSHLVTEQLEGNLLEESRPGAGVPIPAADCSRLTRQAALALAQVHAQGMVFGTLTPDRWWLEPSGNLKILHLPTEPVEAINWSQTEKGEQLRALANVAAPELQNTAPTKQSDLYALGATLFDLLTGNPVFSGDLQTKLGQHQSADVPTPPYVPQSLMQIIQYLMAKNPAGRYQSAEDVAEALRPLVDPSQLAPVPADVPATLGAYLQHLAGQTASAAAPPQPQPVAAPPVPPTPAPFPGQAAPVPPAAPPVPPAAAPVAPPAAAPVPQPVAPPAAAVVPPAEAVANRPTTSRASGLAERVRKRKLRRKITSLVVLGVMAVLALVGGFYGYEILFPPQDIAEVEDHDGSDDPDSPTADPDGSANPDDPGKPQDTDPAGPELVADDGTTLWVSPTSGEAIDLSGLPNDTRLVLAVRPSELVGVPDGERMLRALGPDFAAARAKLEGDLSIRLDGLETLLVGRGASTAGGPPCLVATLQAPTNLVSMWGSPSPVSGSTPPRYVVNGWHVMPVPGQDDRKFIAGSEKVLTQIVADQFQSPQLTRELEQLRRKSDNQQSVSLLFEPSFLLSQSDQALPGELSAARPAIKDFFGDGLRGVLISGDLAENLYLEMRCIGSLSLNPPSLAEGFREKIAGISRQLEDFVPGLNPSPYWRRLANKLPVMVHFAYQHTRSGVDENQAVVNIVLPPPAGQNLVAGTELILAAQHNPGAANPTAQTMAASAKAPETIAEKLQSPISISFPQNSLELALHDIADVAGLEFEIMGPDLMKDGITRNKEIKDFEYENMPAGQVLANLMVRANPEPSPGPNSAAQQLIFVIHPAEGAEENKKLLITTRKAAEANSYQVPDMFKVQ